MKNHITTLAWVLILGILFVRMALFMSYPFLALYLEGYHFNALDIGIILGCHYFFAGITGVFGGSLADRWGPKWTLIASLIIGSLSFLGLSQATSFSSFIIFNSLLAISTSTFEPTASTLILTNCPKESHAYAFRLRYMAINIGAAIGPLIGSLLIFQGPHFSFQMTAAFMFFYFLTCFLIKVPKGSEIQKQPGNVKNMLLHMSKNAPFLILIGANLLVTMTYGQIFSTLPQIINNNVENGRFFYSIVITMNPLIVIIMSFFLNKFLSRQNSKLLFSLGSLLLTLAFFGFHLSPVELHYLHDPFYFCRDGSYSHNIQTTF